jgi:hypothetical protein
MSDDQDLLAHSLAVEVNLLRQHFDLRRAGRQRLVLRPLRNPLPDDLVILRVPVEDLAPFVRDRTDGLQQHQTLVRLDAVEPAAPQVVDQRVVIGIRIVAAEGEFESLFALGRAVAGAGVAADAGEERLDVAHESDRRHRRRLHGHRQLELVLRMIDRDLGGTRRASPDVSVLSERSDEGIELCFGNVGKVDREPVGRLAYDEEAAGVAGVVDRQVLGKDLDALDLRQRGRRRDGRGISRRGRGRTIRIRHDQQADEDQ